MHTCISGWRGWPFKSILALTLSPARWVLIKPLKTVWSEYAEHLRIKLFKADVLRGSRFKGSFDWRYAFIFFLLRLQLLLKKLWTSEQFLVNLSRTRSPKQNRFNLLDVNLIFCSSLLASRIFVQQIENWFAPSHMNIVCFRREWACFPKLFLLEWDCSLYERLLIGAA